MEEIDLKELFNIFWSKKIIILIVLAVFTAVGLIYETSFKTPKYTSSTTLVLAMSTSEKDKGENAITTTDITLNSKLVSTYSEMVKSKDVIRTVISNLKIDEDEEELRKNVAVTSVEDTELIKIEVTHKNPRYAAKIANELAKVFSDKVNEIYKINNVYILDEAEIEDEPSNINYVKDILIFVLAGLVISVGYVFIANMLDTTVKTTEDIEKTCNVPVLATIPVIGNFDKEIGGRRK